MKKETRWKGIVFDFDGTLIDSTREGMKRFLGIAARLGLEVNEDMIARVRRIWGSPGDILISTCWPHISLDIFMEEWEAFDSTVPIALFSGVADVLSLLSKYITLSVLTARGKSTHAQMRFHDLNQHFSDYFICTRDRSPMQKPHSESIGPLFEQYRQYNIGLSDLVFIGDSVHTDYALARTLNMDFIAITWGSCSRADFLAAGLDESRIIDTLQELPALVFL